MSLFLQNAILVIYSLMIISQTIGLVKAIRWARQNGRSPRLSPSKLDLTYLVVMVVGTVLGIKIYQYWGWTLLENVTYYGAVPMLMWAMFNWMNRAIVGEYRLSQFMSGEYTLFVRAMLFIVTLWNARKRAVK